MLCVRRIEVADEQDERLLRAAMASEGSVSPTLRRWVDAQEELGPHSVLVALEMLKTMTTTTGPAELEAIDRILVRLCEEFPEELPALDS